MSAGAVGCAAADGHTSHIPRQETEAGPGERLSFSLEGERRSQGHRLCSTCLRVAPAGPPWQHLKPPPPPPRSQDGRAPAHLTTPAEAEWDAGFGCSSLDPCSTPALSSSARSRCPVTQIHMQDANIRNAHTQDPSQRGHSATLQVVFTRSGP